MKLNRKRSLKYSSVMGDFVENFWEKVGKALAERGMTQKDLAYALGWAGGKLTKLKGTKSGPSFFEVSLIAKALGLSLDDLASDDVRTPRFIPTGEERIFLLGLRKQGISVDDAVSRVYRGTETPQSTPPAPPESPDPRRGKSR